MEQLHCVRPPDLILADTQRATLVRADPKKIKNSQDITALLGESADWGAEWSVKIFKVIVQFHNKYACISKQAAAERKRKRV